ncbi:PEGA domain-containing protein [Polyangium mundeleinium]|uniref:PEGA domain-containing protein n=1 Tax=Polyangium mundeleinium TaxID=2995306 RepID=A0ABT5EIK6_9BACT|nr:PEGA domain-containing protein [Polyangium mundeleinium]MDC0741339.1 PEGA domain-containing protein [Polyangium mundeleinium]
MTNARSILGGMVCLGLLASAREAPAQDVAAAEALFRKGVAEMEAQQFAVACPHIAESQRLDPRPGTLYTLAYCEMNAGRIATAVAHYEDYLRAYDRMTPEQQKKQADRAQKASAQKETLSKEVPELLIVLPPAAPAGTRVLRDGTPMGAAMLGISLPIDPGEHVVVLEVPGAKAVETKVSVARGEKKTLELVLPAPEPAANPKPPPPLVPNVAEKPKEPETPVAPASRGSGLRTGGFVALGIGVAGLVTYGVTGGLAVAKKADVDANCKGTQCNQAGMDAVEQGRTLSTVATVGLGVGVVGVAAGIVMVVMGGGGETKGPVKTGVRAATFDVGPSAVSLGLKGTF